MTTATPAGTCSLLGCKNPTTDATGRCHHHRHGARASLLVGPGRSASVGLVAPPKPVTKPAPEEFEGHAKNPEVSKLMSDDPGAAEFLTTRKFRPYRAEALAGAERNESYGRTFRVEIAGSNEDGHLTIPVDSITDQRSHVSLTTPDGFTEDVSKNAEVWARFVRNPRPDPRSKGDSNLGDYLPEAYDEAVSQGYEAFYANDLETAHDHAPLVRVYDEDSGEVTASGRLTDTDVTDYGGTVLYLDGERHLFDEGTEEVFANFDR